eukprot:Awhi_evm1s6857
MCEPGTFSTGASDSCKTCVGIYSQGCETQESCDSKTGKVDSCKICEFGYTRVLSEGSDDDKYICLPQECPASIFDNVLELPNKLELKVNWTTTLNSNDDRSEYISCPNGYIGDILRFCLKTGTGLSVGRAIVSQQCQTCYPSVPLGNDCVACNGLPVTDCLELYCHRNTSVITCNRCPEGYFVDQVANSCEECYNCSECT